ncbi:MAG: hypothetical protein QM784_05480 [Polyangiaceae bacterium]
MTTQPTPFDEILDAICAEIARCGARASEHASGIEGTGVLATQLTAEIYRDADPNDLLQRVHGIQCAVARGMTLLVELNREAGQLEALARLRRSADVDSA